MRDSVRSPLRMAVRSPWFAFSLELGSRRENLHVQGVIKIRYPGDKNSIKKLTAHLKGFLNTQPGDNSRILIKLCHSGQTEQYMLGYILKDQGQTHFEVSHCNIPDDVMRDAHEAYQIVRTDFTENRKLIT
ncbi:hypothetical protein WJX79_000212 [Trebouxia sp. C0005]